MSKLNRKQKRVLLRLNRMTQRNSRKKRKPNHLLARNPKKNSRDRRIKRRNVLKQELSHLRNLSRVKALKLTRRRQSQSQIIVMRKWRTRKMSCINMVRTLRILQLPSTRERAYVSQCTAKVKATIRRKEHKWGGLRDTTPTPKLIRTQLKVSPRKDASISTTLGSRREK